HVVEPVHVADGLVEGLGLGELLGRAVQQPDVRVGLLDGLAIELEHQAQHAVRGRMLRAEIHRVVADLGQRRSIARCRGHHLPSFEAGASLSAGSYRLSSRITFGTSTRGTMLTGWYTTRFFCVS